MTMKVKEILKRISKVTVLSAIMIVVLLCLTVLLAVVGMSEGVPYLLIIIAFFTVMGIIDFLVRNKDLLKQYSGNEALAATFETAPIAYGAVNVNEKHYKLAYNYPDVEIAGANHYDLTGIEVNMRVTLKPEPENQHDDKAVAVYVGNRKIGFLPKNKLQDMYHDYRFKDGVITAVISAVATDKAAIELNYYKKKDMIAELKRSHETKTFKLTGNSKEEMQDAISYSSVGDEVTYTYDFDKDKYMASAVDDIGFFPKSANKYLENGAEAYIYDIDTDDNDKYYIEVIVNCD